MNSEIIKCVAGAGKTSWSKEYLSQHRNGLYLAFTNSVVDELSSGGAMSFTIDSFFIGFLIPKFVAVIPLIARYSKIEYLDTTKARNPIEKSIGRISINKNGEIMSGNRRTPVTFRTQNSSLHKMANFPSIKSIKIVFGKQRTRLTDGFRNSLMGFLISKYPKEIISLIGVRFDYVIFDEAQDLGGSREEFAKLLYRSDIPTFFLGDAYQKIMPGSGDWFEKIAPTKKRCNSKRCPDDICEWIRNNLGIVIYGNGTKRGGVTGVKVKDVETLDNGKRILLYHSRKGQFTKTIDNWSGPSLTIGKSKGSTLEDDVVIIGKTLNARSYYVALTRTTKKVFTTINKVSK